MGYCNICSESTLFMSAQCHLFIYTGQKSEKGMFTPWDQTLKALQRMYVACRVIWLHAMSLWWEDGLSLPYDNTFPPPHQRNSKLREITYHYRNGKIVDFLHFDNNNNNNVDKLKNLDGKSHETAPFQGDLMAEGALFVVIKFHRYLME